MKQELTKAGTVAGRAVKNECRPRLSQSQAVLRTNLAVELDFRGHDGQLVLTDGSGGGIKRLGPGKQLVMGLEVEVKDAEPKVTTCRVQVKHDELSEGFEDMAAVKVLQPSTPRPAGTGGR